MAVLGPCRCHVPDKRSRSSWHRWLLSSMAKPAGSRRRRALGPPADFRSRAEEVRTRRVSAVPRLSIGLPVYNGERHIGEALESLLGQTYEDFELIVSDNASTDSTSEICLRYARQDRRIRYIRQERNIGLIPNHVFLIEQARGELFKSAAHDDLYGRDLLLRCVQALDDDPNAVLAHPWSAMVDSSGSLVGTFGPGAALDAPAGARQVSERSLRGMPRLRVRNRPDRDSPTCEAAGKLPSRRSDVQCRARPARRISTGGGVVVLPSRTSRSHASKRARQMRHFGPATREPVAASGRPSLRRVSVGMRDGHRTSPFVGHRTGRVLWDPHLLPGFSGGTGDG